MPLQPGDKVKYCGVMEELLDGHENRGIILSKDLYEGNTMYLVRWSNGESIYHYESYLKPCKEDEKEDELDWIDVWGDF